jgi:hypothetical protein
MVSGIGYLAAAATIIGGFCLSLMTGDYLSIFFYNVKLENHRLIFVNENKDSSYRTFGAV